MKLDPIVLVEDAGFGHPMVLRRREIVSLPLNVYDTLQTLSGQPACFPRGSRSVTGHGPYTHHPRGGSGHLTLWASR